MILNSSLEASGPTVATSDRRLLDTIRENMATLSQESEEEVDKDKDFAESVSSHGCECVNFSYPM